MQTFTVVYKTPNDLVLPTAFQPCLLPLSPLSFHLQHNWQGLPAPPRNTNPTSAQRPLQCYSVLLTLASPRFSHGFLPYFTHVSAQMPSLQIGLSQPPSPFKIRMLLLSLLLCPALFSCTGIHWKYCGLGSRGPQ